MKTPATPLLFTLITALAGLSAASSSALADAWHPHDGSAPYYRMHHGHPAWHLRHAPRFGSVVIAPAPVVAPFRHVQPYPYATQVVYGPTVYRNPPGPGVVIDLPPIIIR